MLVVTVCTANICRSPFAAQVLEQLLVERVPAVSVISTGLYAEPGRPAPVPWMDVAAEFGVDLSGHRARGPESVLGESVLEEADLVLAMTADHLRGLVLRWPYLVGRATTLGAAAVATDGFGVRALAMDVLVTGSELDVADPMGRPRRAQRKVAERIVELCTQLARHWPDDGS